MESININTVIIILVVIGLLWLLFEPNKKKITEPYISTFGENPYYFPTVLYNYPEPTIPLNYPLVNFPVYNYQSPDWIDYWTTRYFGYQNDSDREHLPHPHLESVKGDTLF